MNAAVLEAYAERVQFLRAREAKAFERWLGCAADPRLGNELEAYVDWKLCRAVLERTANVLQVAVLMLGGGSR
jgi:maltoporin